ncbi:MAG: hypothetical protein JNK11_07685, partial [Alphaproteobacteria bacterium]|nr:hypothetical protein [Alphaproteobacteria bacterium]
ASYSPYIYLVQARQLVRDYDPDVMVMNVDMNDVVNDYVYERFAVRDADGKLQAIAPINETSQVDYVMTPTGTIAVPKQGAALRWLAENTATGYYVDKVITRWRFSGNLKALNYVAPDETANWLANEWNPAIEATVARTLAAIGDWAAEARAAGVAVALSANPHLPQFEGEWSARPLDALKSYAASKGIPYIDLYAAMSARFPGKEARALFWPPDPTHYNAKGYEVFADVHLAFFASPRGRALLRPRER